MSQLTPQKDASFNSDDSELRTPVSPFYNLKGDAKFITAQEYADSQDYQDELVEEDEEEQPLLDDPFGSTEEDPFAFEEGENEDVLDYQDYPEDGEDDEPRNEDEQLQKDFHNSFNTSRATNSSFATSTANTTNTTFTTNTSFASSNRTNFSTLQSPSDSFISGRTTRTSRTNR